MSSTTSNTFRALISGREDLLIRLQGPITEVADFSPVVFAKLKPVEIDMSEVTAMNSVGVRDFVVWMGKIENPVIKFSHCPKFFIDQVNMIKGLIPVRASFLSFYVPFYSPDTEEEKNVLFTRGLEWEGSGATLKIKIPEVRDTRGKLMELDVIPGRYFQFLSAHP